jgi:hypothetical protein
LLFLATGSITLFGYIVSRSYQFKINFGTTYKTRQGGCTIYTNISSNYAGSSHIKYGTDNGKGVRDSISSILNSIPAGRGPVKDLSLL